MDSGTGKIITNEQRHALLNSAVASDRQQAERYNIRITRDLSEQEKADMKIKVYSPCACGSGKKFKFCCKTKRSA